MQIWANCIKALVIRCHSILCLSPFLLISMWRDRWLVVAARRRCYAKRRWRPVLPGQVAQAFGEGDSCQNASNGLGLTSLVLQGPLQARRAVPRDARPGKSWQPRPAPRREQPRGKAGGSGGLGKARMRHGRPEDW